jgi:NMD protein affecting ribosome stability and mRNA decay
MSKDSLDLCCACGKELPNEQELCYVNFRYMVPGEQTPERILVAATCDKCAKESEDPNAFPVIEALILARVLRIEYPDRVFRP